MSIVYYPLTGPHGPNPNPESLTMSKPKKLPLSLTAEQSDAILLSLRASIARAEDKATEAENVGHHDWKEARDYYHGNIRRWKSCVRSISRAQTAEDRAACERGESLDCPDAHTCRHGIDN